MKTSRRSFPWTILATAAVAGASFVGIASYVNGNRTQSLQSDEVPVSVQDVTPGGGTAKTHSSAQGDEHMNTPSEADMWVTQVDLNQAVKNAGFESARVVGLQIQNHIATVDMNSAIIDTLGSSGEGELIDTLKLALKKDKRVRHFQIRIDGEVQKTLGHTDLSSPVSVR